MPSSSAQHQSCEKYKYITSDAGPMIVPVHDEHNKDEESPAEYNQGGYLVVRVGDTFKDGRYVVTRKLGWGHFSTVWLVRDTVDNRHSALKVVKSAARYTETAKDEIKLLKKVMSANPNHPGREHVVSFLDAFQHRPSLARAREQDIRAGFMPKLGDPSIPKEIHVCIVCEPLGENLLSLLERNKKKGVAIDLVKVIAKQMLLGLQYLHDECGLVHTDIKPENVMISIPDVEAHILSALSCSPTPTSRRVGVPLPKPTRSQLMSHRRPNQSAHASVRLAHQRHVEIFDSQPLSSPTASTTSSPAAHRGLAITRIKNKGKELTPDKGVATVSVSSSVSTTPVFSMAVTPTSTVVSAVSSPPTSLGSAISKLALSTPEPSNGKSSLSVDGTSAERASGTPRPPLHPKISATGPSLLSQTAPHDKRLAAQPALSISEVTPERSAIPHTLSSASLALSLDISSVSSSPHDINLRKSNPLDFPAPTSPVPLPGPSVAHPAPLPPPISIKIADLGNATPAKRHFTEDIQTRQYRAPEAIIGRTDWGYTADVWSVACVIFELLTAEYLFDPQGQGELFTKDDDHMAQIIELISDFPLEVKMGGRFSRELFDSTGALRYIKSLKPWPLDRVMVEKYLFEEEDARAFCDFMLPMLEPDHRKRASAGSMVDSPWLDDQER